VALHRIPLAGRLVRRKAAVTVSVGPVPVMTA
jgi:hypothetical protein